MPRKFLFTSEAVSDGHPDKVCDQISDGLVDAFLARDPDAKTAIECACKSSDIYLLGEINTTAKLTNKDYEDVVRNTLKDIGYQDETNAIDYRTCRVHVNLEQQSPDIAQAVHENRCQEDVAAGDQGLMSAYATDETRSMMPSSYQIANQLLLRLRDQRLAGAMPYLRPDAKAQVTVAYYEDTTGQLYVSAIDTIIISSQHDTQVTNEQLQHEIFEKVVIPAIEDFERNDLINIHQDSDLDHFDYEAFYRSQPKSLQDKLYKLNKDIYQSKIQSNCHLIRPDTKILINPSGRFIIGGPKSDSGLTGRKIVCDAFGGWSQVGGGAYSGKDYSKVDRSASYLCRKICKSIIAGRYAHRCQVQLGYAIGIADPVSVYVETYGFYDAGLPHGKERIHSEEELAALVRKVFRLRPGHIVDDLELKKPIFQKYASYGHFGRERDTCPWEKIIKM